MKTTLKTSENLKTTLETSEDLKTTLETSEDLKTVGVDPGLLWLHSIQKSK